MMNKYFPLFLFLILPLTSFGQRKQNKVNTKWELGPMVNLQIGGERKYSSVKDATERLDYFYKLNWVSADSGIYIKTPIQIRDSFQVDFSGENQRMVNIGFIFRKTFGDNIYQEIGLSKLKFQKTDHDRIVVIDNDSQYPIHSSGAKITLFSLGMRYEIGKHLKKKSDSAFSYRFGIAIEPTYNYWKLLPYVTNLFPNKSNNIAVNFSLSTSICYRFNDNCTIDLKILPSSKTFNLDLLHIENPAYPLRQQRYRKFAFDFQPFLNVNIGLLYNLNLGDISKRSRKSIR
ncbi:MAG: hypothetical protein IPL23_28195 [Saprospiraceae bacterium]|nr:hypothetical protein [Saprospiraceae bacterium]